MDYRLEHDSLGKRSVPADAYYGAQTHRAVENFPISGILPSPEYIEATVSIKRAAAKVNTTLGLLESRKADAIIRAADEVLKGDLREWFVVDVYQAGAGTSHNMNVNEVLANRAIEILGGRKGDYSLVHPNDDVNMAQSTNDVCPTAIRIAGIRCALRLIESLKGLEKSLRLKSGEFASIIKSGRTHLQDAPPVRLGQELGGYAENAGKHVASIFRAVDGMKELGIGGTAVGTGLNSHPQYREMMVQELTNELGIDFRMADDYFETMQSLRPFVGLSGSVRNLAQDLIRIANDLRLMSSGPKTGLAEIGLPPVQPGSSIMPGKVNPVMAEMVNMVSFQVIGCDTTILLAAQSGQLELNVMMPVVAYNLIYELKILSNAIDVFQKFCVDGITVNPVRCREYAERSMSIITVLNPLIGYSRAAEIANEYLKSGKSIKQLVLEKNLLSPQEIDKIFDLEGMTEPKD